MAQAKIADREGYRAVTASIAAGDDHPAVPREVLATAVRYLLQRLAQQATGNTVEVRIPPFGAIQCVEGPGHTRGTPSNVVEMDAVTWIALATGSLSWAAGIESGRIHASGQRADLSAYLPLNLLRAEEPEVSENS